MSPQIASGIIVLTETYIACLQDIDLGRDFVELVVYRKLSDVIVNTSEWNLELILCAWPSTKGWAARSFRDFWPNLTKRQSWELI